MSVPYWSKPQRIRMHICTSTPTYALRGNFRDHAAAPATVASVGVQGYPGEPWGEGFILSYSSNSG